MTVSVVIASIPPRGARLSGALGSVALQLNSGATLSNDATQGYVGSHSLKVVTPGALASEGAAVPIGFIPISPSTTYTLSAWVKAPVGATLVVAARSVTAALGDDRDSVVGFTGTGAWQLVSAGFTSSASGVFADFAVRTNGTVATTFNVDAVELLQGTTTVWQQGYQPWTPGWSATDIHYVDEVALFPGSTRNLLPAAAASFDDGTTGGWSAGVNSTAAALSGTHSLALTIASGSADTVSPKVPVVAGQAYTALTSIEAATLANANWQVYIDWYTASGFLNQSGPTTFTAPLGAFAQGVLAGIIAPAGAVLAAVEVYCYSGTNGQVYYLDQVALIPTNLLSTAASTFEDGTTGGAGVLSNCTISPSTAVAYDGVRSLALTSVAAGAMQVWCSAAVVPVVAGVQYQASAWLSPGSVARNVDVEVVFFDRLGNFLTSMAGTAIAETLNGWIQPTLTVTAPANAAYATVPIDILATGGAGEVHYVDGVSLAPTVIPWQPGYAPWSAGGVNLQAQFDAVGTFRPNGAAGIRSGAGAPTFPATVGDLYIRTDGGGAGTTHLYVCTVATGTWVAIA